MRKIILAGLIVVSSATQASLDPVGLKSPPPGTTIQGRSYSLVLNSPILNEIIPITVMEPTQFTGGKTYPLIFASHAWMIPSSNNPQGLFSSILPALNAGTPGGNYTKLLNAGFGVITYDQRGWWQSNGRVSIGDPDLDGKGQIKVLDWAEQHLDWLAYKDDNLLLGAVGGSYGGGAQFTTLNVDPKKRLDAIVPQITWHDLSYSLTPGQVPKSTWLSILFSTELLNGSRMEPEFKQILLNFVLTNRAKPSEEEVMIYHSNRYFCDGKSFANRATPAAQPPKVDALLIQGNYDTLFNNTEGLRNKDCLDRSGGAVHFMSYQIGHINPSGTGLLSPWPDQLKDLTRCGSHVATDLEVDFFRAKLKGETTSATNLPKYCFALDSSGDAVAFNTMPTDFKTYNIGSRLVGAGLLGALPTTVRLAAQSSDHVMVGEPLLDITLSDPVFGSQSGDPIIFVGLAKNGQLIGDQLRPIRGYGRHQVRLNTIASRLNTGDRLELVYYGFHYQFYTGASRALQPVVRVTGRIQVPEQGRLVAFKSS